jgi:Ca2+-binding EF-hand superfamily protein
MFNLFAEAINDRLAHSFAQAIFFWTLIVRHISCCFESNPSLRPQATPLGRAIDTTNYKKTDLSSAQATQIKEIFELFDTDGGGCIDRKELQFAMTALGFQTQQHHRQDKHQEALEVINTLVGDGKVTLEEFTALMTGELSGQDPYEEARSAFALLSRRDIEPKHDGLITLSKLEGVCQELEVLSRILSGIPVIISLSILQSLAIIPC